MSDLREQIERVVRQVVREVLARGDVLTPAGADQAGRRPLVAANWKMNHTPNTAREYAGGFDPRSDSGVEVALCPPAVLLPVLAAALDPLAGVRLGAQNLHAAPEGAYTGEHSAAMLSEAGADYVILGHSERRCLFGEDDPQIQQKLSRALQAGLWPILCVGESLAERESGATFRVLRSQLTGCLSGLGSPAPDPQGLVVAYEPVWAIGTGRTATSAQAQEALAFIRERLAELFSHGWAARVRLLYGGSATSDNAAELSALPDVDGFLVGGAGLDPDKLSKLIAETASGVARRSDARR